MGRFQFRALPRVLRLGVCLAIACLAAAWIGDASSCFAGCGGYVMLYRGPHVQAARAAMAGQVRIAALHPQAEPGSLPMPPCMNGECRERTTPPSLPPDSPPTRLRTNGDAVAPPFVVGLPHLHVVPLGSATPPSSDEVFLGGIFRPPRNRSGRTS